MRFARKLACGTDWVTLASYYSDTRIIPGVAAQILRSASTAFNPPKAKEFDSAYSTSARRA